MNNRQFENYKRYLKEFISYKSISTDNNFLKDINNTVLFLKRIFSENGFKISVWESKENNPIVFAEYNTVTRLKKPTPTILIYGHYDVQPAAKDDGWSSDPFMLSEKNNRFLGRGVVDNKGQVLVHIATIFDLIQRKMLNFNIKFLIEGNEETGNTSLSLLMKKHAKALKCDSVLISDGELTNNKPSIEVSLRGGFNCRIVFKTAKNNLHSGMWGGGVPNAAFELTKLLSKFYKDDSTISIPGFYKGLVQPTTQELKNNQLLLKESASLEKLAGVKKLLNEKGIDFFTATGLKPNIQISGIKSGYIDTGFSNIIPASAEARINVRIAPNQKSSVIMGILKNFIRVNTPNYVDYEIEYNNPHEPVKVSASNKYLKYAESVLREVYKSEIRKRNVGGAIPFVSDVKSILGVDAVLVPLVNEDCNMHGVDENFNLKYLKKAFEFSDKFFSRDI